MYTLKLERWLLKALAALAENPHGLDLGKWLEGPGREGRRHVPPISSWRSGPEVHVLLFNSTGDRDSAALLKLLQVKGPPGGWAAGGTAGRR